MIDQGEAQTQKTIDGVSGIANKYGKKYGAGDVVPGKYPTNQPTQKKKHNLKISCIIIFFFGCTLFFFTKQKDLSGVDQQGGTTQLEAEAPAAQLEAEPKSLEAEPKELEAEPKELEAEPKSLEAEPEELEAEAEEANAAYYEDPQPKVFRPSGALNHESRNNGTPVLVVLLFLAIASGMIYWLYLEVSQLKESWYNAVFEGKASAAKKTKTKTKLSLAAKPQKGYKSFRQAFREIDSLELADAAKQQTQQQQQQTRRSIMKPATAMTSLTGGSKISAASAGVKSLSTRIKDKFSLHGEYVPV